MRKNKPDKNILEKYGMIFIDSFSRAIYHKRRR